MQPLCFRSVFTKLFASVMLALILFAVAMVSLTQLVHDKDSGIRSEVLATQILGQIDPFLGDLNTAIGDENRLQSRFMLAVVKKSFDIFDESLQAKMGLYDNQGRLLLQTDNSNLPLELPATPSLLSRIFPSFSDTSPTLQAQVYSSTGYTLLYESRLPPKKSVPSAALNLFTGTILLLIIMAGVLWFIARTMTWRINQMSQQMTQLGDGDFSVRVNARGNDEIASLARGFNQAAQKIEHLINANNLLLAHASHEIRTPITRIRLQIEMMDMLASTMAIETKAKFDKRAQAINRDLSGLNDLVESILLVSRLDAGHAMQQLESFDIYDLVNQERQHYSEATLIGEHILIEGQPLMLTHLIRNLLNNAMLHGIPPVTILLYGVQTLDEADTIPDYLLQSIVNSSFADDNDLDYNSDLDNKSIEYNTLDDTDNTTAYEKTLTDKTLTANTAKHPTFTHLDTHLEPIIYGNGDTLSTNPDVPDNLNHGIKDNHTRDNNSVDHKVTPDNKARPNIDDEPSINSASNEVTTPSMPAISNNVFIHHYHRFTTELAGKVKKVVWNIVPETPISDTTSNDANNIDEHNDTVNDNKNNNNKDSANNQTGDNSEILSVPRKESLFTKRLKKSKSEPTRPTPNYMVLAVMDDGDGIPEDKRLDIFSPFVRLQQKKKGSGLGLSLVSQIVTAHQGRITTDTVNGHTRFLVVIPVKYDSHYSYQNSHQNSYQNKEISDKPLPK